MNSTLPAGVHWSVLGKGEDSGSSVGLLYFVGELILDQPSLSVPLLLLYKKNYLSRGALKPILCRNVTHTVIVFTVLVVVG